MDVGPHPQAGRATRVQDFRYRRRRLDAGRWSILDAGLQPGQIAPLRLPGLRIPASAQIHPLWCASETKGPLQSEGPFCFTGSTRSDVRTPDGVGRSTTARMRGRTLRHRVRKSDSATAPTGRRSSGAAAQSLRAHQSVQEVGSASPFFHKFSSQIRDGYAQRQSLPDPFVYLACISVFLWMASTVMRSAAEKPPN